jgi:FkbM family methyltransferase
LWTVLRKYSRFGSLARRIMPAVRIVRLSIPDYPHPFEVRWPGSDIHIAHSILARAEYERLTNMIDRSEPIIVLDIGANVGAASAFFLNAFPNAQVIAVEPDPGNAEMCSRNVRPFGNRATVKRAALWSKNEMLTFERETLGVGTEAVVKVREARRGEAGIVQGIDVPTLLAEISLEGDPRIVMKIDVEGAEREIFSSNTEWLRHVDFIAIELHDYLPGAEDCREIFTKAMEPYLAEESKSTDTTFIRLRPHGAPDTIGQ